MVAEYLMAYVIVYIRTRYGHQKPSVPPMKTRLLLSTLLLAGFLPGQVFAQDNGDYIVIEDFESDAQITLTTMANGSHDSPEAFEWVENPAPDEVNPSDWVMSFTRAHDGESFAGFWSALPEAIDMTDHKYVHVQVWKPRLSPVRFKVEQGTTTPDQFEITPMEPQSVVDGWENLVFYFADATGPYPVIAFMPDFEEPLTITEDFTLYFDNIILSDSPEPPAIGTSNEGGLELPLAIGLDQNYPNPFNPSTTISFDLAKSGHVSLVVYDLTGRAVATLVEGVRTAGQHDVSFDAANLPSGLYLYRLQSDGRSLARTMTLLK